jgi:hypothetical protein
MKEPLTTIKIWTATRKLLRLIAASTGERMVEVMHRLVTAEWERQQNTTQEDVHERDSHTG